MGDLAVVKRGAVVVVDPWCCNGRWSAAVHCGPDGGVARGKRTRVSASLRLSRGGHNACVIYKLNGHENRCSLQNKTLL